MFLFNVNGKLSDDCATNKQKAMECKRIKAFTEVVVDFDPPELTAETVVIDGLFRRWTEQNACRWVRLFGEIHQPIACKGGKYRPAFGSDDRG